MSLGSAAVALIILIDLASGQGPPGLANYVGLMPPPLPEFRRPLPVRPLPAQYLPPGADVEYGENKKFDKEFEKEASKESSKGFSKFFEKSKDEGEKSSYSKEQNKGYATQEYGSQKSYGVPEPKKAQFYGYQPPSSAQGSNYGPSLMYGGYEKEKEKKNYNNTPAPGMLASLSQTMSKAWNSWG